MKRIILVLTAVLILLFPFQPVKAETTYDLNDFKEYDSFMKRYHEHSMELTYFVNATYNSNEHYFKENFDLFRDTINKVYDTSKSEFLTRYLESSEDLFSKPIAMLATASDLRKYLWDKFKSIFTDENEEYDSGIGLSAPAGYGWVVNDGNEFYDRVFLQLLSTYCYQVDVKVIDGSGNVRNVANVTYTCGEGQQYYDYYQNSLKDTLNDGSYGLSGVYTVLAQSNSIYNVNTTITLKNKVTNEVIPLKQPNPTINNIVNNISNGYNTKGVDENYTPTVQPQLVCPTGLVPLTYDTGTFKTLQGEIVTIQENETANYLENLCNLDFAFPEIYYHDGTGALVVGGQPLNVMPPVEQIDTGIIEYIRNSYNYATTVINSGVNGLKSIISGTAGLVTFSGSLFGFLPPEILTLFIGGFSIALGLWVFKK